MSLDRPGDPESILTSTAEMESTDTLLFVLPSDRPSPVETAVLQYADSIEHLTRRDGTAPDDPYTRGFVAGLRAAAKVAANVTAT